MNSNDRAILRNLLALRIKKARKLRSVGRNSKAMQVGEECRVLHELCNMPSHEPCPSWRSY